MSSCIASFKGPDQDDVYVSVNRAKHSPVAVFESISTFAEAGSMVRANVNWARLAAELTASFILEGHCAGTQAIPASARTKKTRPQQTHRCTCAVDRELNPPLVAIALTGSVVSLSKRRAYSIRNIGLMLHARKRYGKRAPLA